MREQRMGKSRGFTAEQAGRVREGKCPWCGACDFEYIKDWHDGSAVWLRYGCNVCDGKWEEKYGLEGALPLVDDAGLPLAEGDRETRE